MNITEKIIRKLKSAGVEKAEAHAEVITEVIEDVLKKIPTKDYVDSQFAQQAATNGQFHKETQAELENQRTKSTEDRSETQIGFAQINAKIDSGFANQDQKMETGFANQDQKNTELRAEMETGFANQDQKNTELRAEMLAGFANQDQKNTELRAEMLAGFANQTAMLKSSQFSLLRWTVGSIFVIIGFLATLIYFLLRQGPS